MKFTLGWLKEHLDTMAKVDEIAETLTRIGLEVEGIFDPAPPPPPAVSEIPAAPPPDAAAPPSPPLTPPGAPE